MESPVMATLEDGRNVILNEEQICSITHGKPIGKNQMAIIRMSNGDTWICVDPPYRLWENDFVVRKR